MEPTKYSMLQAAKRIGVSPSTMSRYVHNGKISSTKLENGGYEIDDSDLARAFPDAWQRYRDGGSVEGPETPGWNGEEPDETVPGTPNKSGALTAEVKALRELLERMDIDRDRERREASNTIEDLRRRLDQEGEERRALNARLLTYQKPPEAMTPPPPPPATPAKRSGLFGLFKKAS